MRNACPLCDSGDLFVFVERERVPVHQNVPLKSAAAARSAPRGDLRLACCRVCGFVTNLAFRQDLLQYGEGYENDQTRSPTFEAHTESLVTSLVAAGVQGKFVIDVGCGQGQFLRRLCAAGGNRGLGFDPAYVGPDRVDDGRVSFVREFYGGRPPTESPDLVVCRHVIEHVPAPVDFLTLIRATLSAGRVTRLAFETPTVDWILERTVIQDFFYEHCSYFTPESLGFAFDRAGFSNFAATRVFGGQYMWAMAEYAGAASSAESRRAPTQLVRSADGYAKTVRLRTEAVLRALEGFRSLGVVAIWGAGAKGVTFLNLVDPACTLVDCTVDVNPRKQGKFVAGTGHPIVSPAELAPRDVRTVVVMNPNYVEEIRRLVGDTGRTVDVVTEEQL